MAFVLAYPAAMPFWRSDRPPAARPADADAADVARAAAGDETAFEVLVTRHERSLFRLAHRMLGHREDAAEAVQETFIRVLRALPRFRGEASFRTWVTGIALNVCRNRLASAERRTRRLAVPLQTEDPDGGPTRPLPLPDPTPSPEATVLGGELRRALEAALVTIAPEHREVVLLREMEGLEYEEMAALLGCPVGTVKSRLARARSALRAALEGVWP